MMYNKNAFLVATVVAVGAVLFLAGWFVGSGSIVPEARAHGCWGGGSHKGTSDAGTYAGCACPMCSKATGFETEVIDVSDPTAELYAAKCSACHALPSRKTHTAEEWDVVVSTMEGYMEHHTSMMDTEGLKMSPEERELILDYLETGAK